MGYDLQGSRNAHKIKATDQDSWDQNWHHKLVVTGKHSSTKPKAQYLQNVLGTANCA